MERIKKLFNNIKEFIGKLLEEYIDSDRRWIYEKYIYRG